MKNIGTIELETERLILRRFTLGDTKCMYNNWASDSEVTKFLTWETHKSIAETKKFLNLCTKVYKYPQVYQWMIHLKEINEPIGTIGATNCNLKAEFVTVGYCIGKKWWGKGYTVEAFKRLIKFFFEEVGVNTVNACHDKNNPNSGKVMKKAGLTYDGMRRCAGFNNQGICDEVWYSILKDEYFNNNNGKNNL